MKLLTKPNYRCEDNIRMDIKGALCDIADEIYLTQDRIQWLAVVMTVIGLLVP